MSLSRGSTYTSNVADSLVRHGKASLAERFGGGTTSLELLRASLVPSQQLSRTGRIDVLRERQGNRSIANDDRVRSNREGEGEECNEGLAEEHGCKRRELRWPGEQATLTLPFIRIRQLDKSPGCTRCCLFVENS